MSDSQSAQENHSSKSGTPTCAQRKQSSLAYVPVIPTTPDTIEQLYSTSVATVTALFQSVKASAAPEEKKLLSIIAAWKKGCEKLMAEKILTEAGEAHLREEVKEKSNEKSADKRCVAPKEQQSTYENVSETTYATVLDRGSSLYKRKKERDRLDTKNQARKHSRLDTSQRNKENKPSTPLKSQIPKNSSAYPSQSLTSSQTLASLKSPDPSKFFSSNEILSSNLFEQASQLSPE